MLQNFFFIVAKYKVPGTYTGKFWSEIDYLSFYDDFLLKP
jgi:hypothetical protein